MIVKTVNGYEEREVAGVEQETLTGRQRGYAVVPPREIPVLKPGEIIHWVLGSSVPIIFQGKQDESYGKEYW